MISATTTLVRPDLRFHASWATAVREFGVPAGMAGSGLWTMDTSDLSIEALERLLAPILAAVHTPEQEGFVRSSYFWIVEDEEFVGYLALRHELNDFLLDQGGNIGYSVRPSRRREGHAARALGLALDEARALGLDRVLVTCDDDNIGSYRTIERNGGVLEDVRGVKRRYWIEL
ncbi:GNAT family N-acetyltransferase [Nocardioides fonticola]|uniref:GNAT family N-acetyltransferase n=1 Tax=Nocardioides fonticola TaxID=450363 RepID=A0ABP7Y373_9ACTN